MAPIGSYSESSTPHVAGFRVKHGRTGRHRGVYWRPTCAHCGHGGYVARHSDVSKQTIAIPCSFYGMLPYLPTPPNAASVVASHSLPAEASARPLCTNIHDIILSTCPVASYYLEQQSYSKKACGGVSQLWVCIRIGMGR